MAYKKGSASYLRKWEDRVNARSDARSLICAMMSWMSSTGRRGDGVSRSSSGFSNESFISANDRVDIVLTVVDIVDVDEKETKHHWKMEISSAITGRSFQGTWSAPCPLFKFQTLKLCVLSFPLSMISPPRPTF